MIIRPVDENGDILPVLVSASLLKGSGAVARLVKDRLDLLAGEWWENPAWGNGVIDMLKDYRLTEADSQALANYITSYNPADPRCAGGGGRGVLHGREVFLLFLQGGYGGRRRTDRLHAVNIR